MQQIFIELYNYRPAGPMPGKRENRFREENAMLPKFDVATVGKCGSKEPCV